MTPEEKARKLIDAQLTASGWAVQTKDKINLSASRGVAICELSFATGEPDYTLFVDGKALGTVEAKPEGHPLIGVEEQSAKYVAAVPGGLPAWRTPLPFSYESTGSETRFTSRLDPDPRSRQVFAFHRPETLLRWVQQVAGGGSPLAQRLREFPVLSSAGLWPAQVVAITNLEKSLAASRRRALIQMATGSGKTFTAVNCVYRILKQADINTRILFLVDRANLGEQTLKEFQQFVSPVNHYKFTEEFIVQHLTGNSLDQSARVVIGTIQRLYSMLRGEPELDPERDEKSGYELVESLWKEPLPVIYNPALPIETFDFIITDECHRSIYNLWRQVLEYFDASLIGLTATPNKQTFGFFEQNLVMEYNHEKAVADGVNVNYDVYRIRTDITERGSKVEAGLFVDKRDRLTRKKRWEQLDDDLTYEARQLDRDVVSEGQIRTVLSTFRDRLFTEIFPGRTDVPKTLIFAKDDSHADDIVRLCREVFGKGNDFCQKITYRTTGAKPRDLIQKFRNSYEPRIAVTVDMIATGTDVKPLEIVLFMRSVKSLSYFEQMKGRGVRVMTDTEFQAVTPDAKSKIEKQFTRLEAGLAALRRVQANLKRYRAAVLKAACEGRLVPTEAELARKERRKYEPANVLIARTPTPPRPNRWNSRSKDVIPGHPALAVGNPQTKLPEGWEWSALVEIAKMESGHTPSRNHPEWWNGNVAWIGIADAREHDGRAIHETFQHTNLDGITNSASRLLPAGTVCISRTASVGYVVVMGREMATSQDFVNWIPTSAVTSDWLRIVFSADREGLRRFGKGSVHKTIYFPEWLSMHIAVPPLAEQTRIVAEVERRLSVVEELEAVVSANLQRSTRLRQSILQKAFSGELVAQERPAVSANVIPLLKVEDHKRPNRHFARAVLSAEIVHQLHREPTFGRIKHQKIFHLCEHIARIEEIQGQYHREAAGPLDNKLIYANEAELKKQQWYQEIGRKRFGHAYQPLARAGGHRKYLEGYWPEKLPIIESLINLMRTWDTDLCEIFCTAYAAWNDLILWGKPATEENILREILERWHESKKRFAPERWYKAIGWMKKKGFAPTGFGRPTAASSS